MANDSYWVAVKFRDIKRVGAAYQIETEGKQVRLLKSQIKGVASRGLIVIPRWLALSHGLDFANTDIDGVASGDASWEPKREG